MIVTIRNKKNIKKIKDFFPSAGHRAHKSSNIYIIAFRNNMVSISRKLGEVSALPESVEECGAVNISTFSMQEECSALSHIDNIGAIECIHLKTYKHIFEMRHYTVVASFVLYNGTTIAMPVRCANYCNIITHAGGKITEFSEQLQYTRAQMNDSKFLMKNFENIHIRTSNMFFVPGLAKRILKNG